MKKTLSLLLATLLFASMMVGCDQGGSSSTDSSSGERTQTMTDISFAKDAVNNTDLYFVKDAVTNYKILLSDDASMEEEYAADFLQETVRAATGVRLTTVVEETGNTDGYYISIGNTMMLEKSGIELDADKLNVNGFVLALVDNSVIICGASEVGTVYGVQEFLSYIINYEVYALDEIYYDKTSTVRMIDFGTLNVAPSIAYYGPGTYQASTVDDAVILRSCSRLDLWDNLSGAIWDGDFIDHSILKIAPKEQYPEWYAGSQICYSKPEIEDYIAEKIVEKMKVNPETVFLYQVGNADDPSSCTCEDCTKLANDNGTIGGAYVIWLNRIAEKTETLMKQEGVQKDKWYIVGLMYNAFETAPVVYDETTDTYKPYNDNVICGEHVGVQYCPIRACHAHPFSDDNCQWNTEAQTKKDYFGWAALTDFYATWTYNAEFYNFLFLFDDFGSFAQNLKDAETIGVDFYIYQRTNNENGVFDKLRTYLVTQLGWNAGLDYDQLVNDFFTNYYKEAAPYMKEYYDAIRAQMHKVGQGFNYDGCLAYNMAAGNYFAVANWPFQLLQSYEKILEKAYKAIENAGYSAAEQEKMRLRIRTEEIFCTAFFVRNYSAYFTDSEYKKMKTEYLADCKKLGITQGSEGAFNLS